MTARLTLMTLACLVLVYAGVYLFYRGTAQVPFAGGKGIFYSQGSVGDVLSLAFKPINWLDVHVLGGPVSLNGGDEKLGDYVPAP